MDPTTRFAPAPDPAPPAVSRLRGFNAVLAAVHAVSALVMLALADDFSLDVGALFANSQPGPGLSPDRLETVFGFPLALGTVAFLLLSALFHLLVVLPWGWSRYRRELHNGLNRFRWVEYSLSATLMVVLIALVVGVADIAALIGVAGANAAMILFGWIMEVTNPPDRTATWWTPFVMGCVVGAVPWIAIGVYLVGAGSSVPGFVYGIFVSLFVFFNAFAVNQWLQYRGSGRFADYLFGERVYGWLSLTAKSALAWQIFANTLV